MNKLLTAAGLSLALLVGCGGDGAELVSKAKKITDEFCACKDDECADKVREKRDAFRKELKSKFKKKEDVPEDLLKKFGEYDKQWSECSDKLREAAEE